MQIAGEWLIILFKEKRASCEYILMLHKIIHSFMLPLSYYCVSIDLLSDPIIFVGWVDRRVLSKHTSYSNKKDHVSLCFKSSHSFLWSTFATTTKRAQFWKLQKVKVCVYKILLQRIKRDQIPTPHF